MTKLANAALILSVATRSILACDQVAVLYGDTKYLLLDGDTLAVVDAGNLRWLGLFRIQAIIPGSTSRLFAVSADRLSSELYRGDEKGHYPSKLVIVENVAETDDTGARVEIGHYDIRSTHTRLIGGTDQLAAWREKASRLSLLGRDFEEIDGWRVSGYKPDATLACRIGNRVVFGGLRTRFEARHGEVEPLPFPDGTADCRTWNILLGCLTGFECRRRGKFVAGVLDLAANAVVSTFEYESLFTIPKDPAHVRPFAKFKNRLLFAGGTRLLQQEMSYTAEKPVANVWRVLPTPRFRVIDTESGRVAIENNIAPIGRASRLFCPGGKERFVVSGNGEAHMIDLATLKTVATASIPQGRPWVF